MKNLFLVLALFVLLAKIPASEFNKIPDQDEFLRLLCSVFIEKFQCENGAIVGRTEVNGEVYFFGDCIEKRKEVEL